MQYIKTPFIAVYIQKISFPYQPQVQLGPYLVSLGPEVRLLQLTNVFFQDIKLRKKESKAEVVSLSIMKIGNVGMHT